jgi:hypothetical protein
MQLYTTARHSIHQIANADLFYRELLGMRESEVTEVHKIAFHTEVDHLMLTTAVDLFLRDRGIRLKDYSMNLRQRSLNFHDAGLSQVHNSWAYFLACPTQKITKTLDQRSRRERFLFLLRRPFTKYIRSSTICTSLLLSG